MGGPNAKELLKKITRPGKARLCGLRIAAFRIVAGGEGLALAAVVRGRSVIGGDGARELIELRVDLSALGRRRRAEEQELAAVAAKRMAFRGDAGIFAALFGRRRLKLSGATAGAGTGDLRPQLGAIGTFACGGRNGKEAERHAGGDRQFPPPGGAYRWKKVYGPGLIGVLALSRFRKKAEELLVRPHDYDAPTCGESRHSRQYRLWIKRAQFVPRIMSATRRRRATPMPPGDCDFFAPPTVEALHLPRYLAHIGDGVARARL